MRTEIYADVTDGSRVWLAEGLDGRREAVAGLDDAWSKPLQVVHGVEADTVEVFDRGGVQLSVPFTVTRIFDSEAAARRYAREHAAVLGKLPGRLTFVHHDAEGADVWVLEGHLASARPHRLGVTVATAYEVTAARWSRPPAY